MLSTGNNCNLILEDVVFFYDSRHLKREGERDQKCQNDDMLSSECLFNKDSR